MNENSGFRIQKKNRFFSSGALVRPLSMAKPEAGTNISKKLKPKPIFRIAIYLISHSFLFSIICCIAGIVALLLLPILAKNTYISENALMPGSASSMLSYQDVSEASRLVKDITNLKFEAAKQNMEIQRLLAQYMSSLGAEVNYHNFHPPPNNFHPLQFFSSPDSYMVQDIRNCSAIGVNTVGIIRAPRGDGKESIVFVTPYNAARIDISDAMSLGVAYSVFSLLSRVTWLAKDIIWLAADTQYGEYAAVSSWLRDYHSPIFSDLGLNENTCYESGSFSNLGETTVAKNKIADYFRRAGTMAAALVIKIADRNEESEDTLSIYAEGSNGQMPNLDLINIVNYLAVYKQGLRVKVEKMWCLLQLKWLKFVGEILEAVGNFAGSLNSKWKFGMPASEYVEGTSTLASSLYNQALGVPTGSHGAFRDYQVDAITLEISSRVSLYNNVRQNEFLQRGGELIEGVVRSVNNLLEKFHQSFFLYLLTSPSKFVSVGIYMISFALLVAPLPVAAASLYLGAYPVNMIYHNTDSTASSDSDGCISLKSWKWLHVAKHVFIMHLWGAIISALPYFIHQIPNLNPSSCIMIWVLLSLVIFFILYLVYGSPSMHAVVASSQKQEWYILKAMTIAATFIGLSLMSVINFATAEFGALLLVPMCLVAQPFNFGIRDRTLKALTVASCNLVLGTLGCPPVTYFVIKAAFGGYHGIDLGDFWIWLESLWAWSSATYLYIGMLHLPCWVLCICILFHRC